MIMPGGGIKPNTIHQFKEKEFQAVHLSAVKFQKTLDRIPKISMNSISFLKEDAVAISSAEDIRHIVEFVK